MPRAVIQRVSVKASMLAAPPPKREPVPEAPDAAEGGVGLVVHGLVVDVHDAGGDPVGELEAAHHVAW